jgi:thiopeptide-type bacteriocin biosynthesis protein
VARRFAPASEWLYAKIYGSPAILDRILVEAVQPAIRELQRSGLAKRWFFIRYWDQQPHLRVRLHGPPQRMRNEAWRKLELALRPYLDRGDIWTLQLDTYEREVERYGGPGAIEGAERFFTADSDLAVALIELDPDRADDFREHFAVASIHALLTDFGFDHAARLTWTRSVRDSLLADLGLAPDTLIGLGRHFRTAKSSLERLLDPHPDATGAVAAESGDDVREVIRAALRQRSPEAEAFAATLRRQERAGELTASMSGVIASLAHMSVNRLVPRSPRTVELAILDFLHRLYAGEAARSRPRQARTRPP